MTFYKKFINTQATERKMVSVGRWSVVGASLIAIVIAPALRSFDQVYQFIQEYVGFISPGVLAIFLLGFFWKRTTGAAAITGIITGLRH